MLKSIRLMLIGVFGMSATTAQASLSLDDEMYAATKEQGTLEAYELFLETYPKSSHAEDAMRETRELIRQIHRQQSFQEDPVLLAQRGFFEELGRLFGGGNNSSEGGSTDQAVHGFSGDTNSPPSFGPSGGY